MKIAIIGGGASGLMTAHLLGDQYGIDLYEKSSNLGGNIRTLNKNVRVSSMPLGVHTENGVTVFNTTTYPHFHRFLKNLNVETTGAFLPGSFFTPTSVYQTPSSFMFEHDGVLKSISHLTTLRHLTKDWARFIARSRVASEKKIKQSQLSEYLTDNSDFEKWMKCVCMMTYSLSYQDTSQVPCELGLRLFTTWLTNFYWICIKGGVFSYIEKILEDFSGEIFLNSKIDSIIREEQKIKIFFQNGSHKVYDAVVFATPPHEILNILKDATPTEKRRFTLWKANQAKTIAHTDTSMYLAHKRAPYSLFDQFEIEKDVRFGYNTYFNHSYSIPLDTHYSFSFGMDEYIEPSKILDTWEHITPLYEPLSFKSRDEIIETNGEKNCFYVGAYLGDGLHEGALVSAIRVSRLISMGIRTSAKQAKEEMKFKLTA